MLSASNPLSHLFAFCQMPQVDRDLDLDGDWRTAVKELRSHFDKQLLEQRRHFEEMIQVNEKRHAEQMHDLRAHLLSNPAASVEEVEMMRTDLKNLHHMKEVVAALEANQNMFKDAGAQFKARPDFFQVMDSLRNDIETVRARALLVPTTEDELNDLRKRVEATKAMEEPLIGCTSPASPAKSPANAEEQKLSRKEAANKKKREEDLLARHELLGKHSLMVALIQQELQVLRSDIETVKQRVQVGHESIGILRDEMHRNSEAVSIKAGFLALSLTDCTEDERGRIHSMLKEKEKSIMGSASGLLFYTTVIDQPNGMGESIHLPATHFPIELDRTEGQVLGLKLSTSMGTCLVIEAFQDGLARDYNMTCLPPQEPLRVKDRIVQVNEVRGFAALLQRELELKKKHRCIVERRHDQN